MSIYTIEGNIGSGKSTLLKLLAKYKPIIAIQEPVNVWRSIKDIDGKDMIEKFYKNQEKYAFSFQMMAYISRLHLLKKNLRENPNGIFITERSVFTDRNVFAKMLYDDGKIESVNYEIYLQWFDEFVKDIPIKGIIYLKTTPNICFERIKKRNRKGEENMSTKYINRCHGYHQEWISNIKTISNVLILDGDITNPELHFSQIKLFICNHDWCDISAFDVQNHDREYQCTKCNLIK